jgi:hypothetical protein
MGTTRKRKLFFVPALAALLLGAVVAGQAAAAAQPDAAADNHEDVVACDGGPQQRALVRLNNAPTTTDSMAGIQPLPGASIPFVVPAGQTRQVIVTFAAQAFLENAPLDLAQPVDEIQVTVLLDGAPMPPANGVTFNTDAGQYDALEACRRVGEGAHMITVVWQVVDTGAANNPVGTLETWTLHAEINL